MSDLELRWFLAPGRPTEPPDQGVKMAIFHAVDPSQIGDDPVPRLASLIAERLDDLKIASPPAFIDANEHAYKLSASAQRINAK